MTAGRCLPFLATRLDEMAARGGREFSQYAPRASPAPSGVSLVLQEMLGAYI